MDSRYQDLINWLATQLGHSPDALEPVSGDASFRRYFRLNTDEGTRVVMDAPPEKEDSTAFVALAHHWHAAGIHVPAILAQDLEQGFLLLEDLGAALYLDVLNGNEQADQLYRDALDALLDIQSQPSPPDYTQPPYDDALFDREMHLFPDWLLERKLGLELSSQEKALLETTFATLRESALAQPRVTVHRDYHSRNLLVTPQNNPGIIDFQDAVTGPVTYDAVSLLKDCYIEWPREQMLEWLEYFRQGAAGRGLHRADPDTFLQWFELMGMQRHLKAAGIFARLDVRDGKPGYIADIPRVLGYIIAAGDRQPALQRFSDWLRERVLPAVESMQESAD